MERKAYERPNPGIFYMVPDPKTGAYSVYTQIQEQGGADVAHLFLYEGPVKRLLANRFKADLEGNDSYTGIPRGRIVEPSDIRGDWLFTHGNDFPLEKYKDELISEFSLRDAVDLGKVKFVVDPHEKMGPKDQKDLSSILGIKITPTGWTSTRKKKP